MNNETVTTVIEILEELKTSRGSYEEIMSKLDISDEFFMNILRDVIQTESKLLGSSAEQLKQNKNRGLGNDEKV